jgi:hypothetical protein
MSLPTLIDQLIKISQLKTIQIEYSAAFDNFQEIIRIVKF